MIIGLVISLLIIFLIVIILWILPILQIKNKKELLNHIEYLQIENEYRKTIAQILGGIFVLIGLSFTWYQLLATQDSIAISREALITDRYSKAIDQLGESMALTRLGGLYALGKIAEQSPQYVSIINNVLSSYIRQSVESKINVRDEIQAAITIITSKNKYLILDSINNNSVHLSNIELINFDFKKGMLSGSDLSNTDFSNSSFIEANLSQVIAIASNFSNCNFTNAKVISSKLAGSKLRMAILKGANFRGSDLRLADFREADCSNCDFTEANLSEVNFDNSNLSGANLFSAIGITSKQLTQAKTDSLTKFPSKY